MKIYHKLVVISILQGFNHLFDMLLFITMKEVNLIPLIPILLILAISLRRTFLSCMKPRGSSGMRLLGPPELYHRKRSIPWVFA